MQPISPATKATHLEHVAAPNVPPAQDLSVNELRAINAQLGALVSRLEVIRWAALLFILSVIVSILVGGFLVVQAVRTANWNSCMADQPNYLQVERCGVKP